MPSVKIVRRSEVKLSAWVTLVEKDVEFSSAQPIQTYHSLKQADYVGILAMTPTGKIPLIWQFRPAIERYTWELPGGLVEAGESPTDCCRRELREEVGSPARSITHLGTQPAEVGRLENFHHMYFVETDEPDSSFEPEPGTKVEFVTRNELEDRIQDGRLSHPLHLAIILLYDLERKRGR